MQDMNMDGSADIVLKQPGLINVFFSKNGGYVNSASYYSTTSSYSNSVLLPSSISQPNYYSCLLEIKDSNLIKIKYKQDASKQYLLTGLVNSLGIVEHNFYNRLNDTSTSFYNNNADVSFPYEPIQGALWMLSAKERFLNTTTIASETYSYEGGVVHRQGKGFCGFSKVKTNELIQDHLTTVTYNPLLFGVPLQTLTPTLQADYTYSSTIATNKKAKVLMTKSVEKDLLTAVTITKEYVYDTYGNPLREAITYSDETTTNVIKNVTLQTYSNNTSSALWLIGLPLEKTVTATRGDSTWVTSETLSYKTGTNLPESRINKIGTKKADETRWTYDAYGNLLTEKSAPRDATEFLGDTYTYINNNYLATKTNSLAQPVIYTNYNKFGKPTSIMDFQLKATTLYSYDDLGRAITVNHPDGTTEQVNYVWDTSIGLYYIEQTATNAPTTRTYYDALEREVRSAIKRFDGTWQYIDKQYDAKGRLSKESLPFKGTTATAWNSYSYDIYNRPTAIREASGKSTTYSYSGNSKTVTKNGIASKYTYDKSGQLSSVEDPAGTIGYVYRPDGQLKATVAPGPVTTSFEYDAYGNRSKITDPSAGVISFTNNYSGNILTTSYTDANGKTVTTVYDKYGRPVSKTMPEFTTSYTYDATTKQLASVVSSNGSSCIYTYDALGRLSTEKEITPDSVWLQRLYTYASGNVSSIAYTSSKEGTIGTENFVYTNGHLTERKMGTTSIWKLTAENSLGQPTAVTTGPLSRTYSYTAYGLPTERKVGTLQHFSYNFDVTKGNLTDRTDKSRSLTEAFTYDNLNRLTGFGDKTTSYDNKGNITSLSDVGTLSYTHATKPYAVTGVTTNSNLLPVRSQSVTYTSFQRPATLAENGYVATFSYNVEGDRTKMELAHNGTVQNTVYYMGNCYETDNTTSRLYLGGDYYSAPAVWVKNGSGTAIYYICRDYLGSITHVTKSDGTLQQELSYDAWGRLRNPVTQVVYSPDESPALFLGRGYTGHEYLSAFGLINMNARLYDPVLGRFLSPDPYIQMIDFTQNFNRYSYGLNNPLCYVDENGEIFWIVVGVAAGIGAIVNVVAHWEEIQAAGGGWNSVWKGISYGAVGAAAGAGAATVIMGNVAGFSAMTALTGQQMATQMSLAFMGFQNGAITGAYAGVTAGAIIGSGNAIVEGESFGEILAGGFQGAITGVTLGSTIGGITGGMNAWLKGRNFWTGEFIPYKNEGKPLELHHYASNKNQTYTRKFKDITDKYGLDLNGSWNVDYLPHSGRHPNKYHEFVLKKLMEIDKVANGNVQTFLTLFDRYVKAEVKLHPEMLRKSFYLK